MENGRAKPHLQRPVESVKVPEVEMDFWYLLQDPKRRHQLGDPAWATTLVMVDVAAQNPLCAALTTKSDENAYLSNGRRVRKYLVTSREHFVTSQPDVVAQSVPYVFTNVELVRATYISRKRQNWETRRRQSKAFKSAERAAKRKLMAQPEISHEAAEQILLSRATRTDEHFQTSYTSATNSLCCMVTTMWYLANSVVPSTLAGL